MDWVLVVEILIILGVTVLATWGSKAWVKYYKSKQSNTDNKPKKGRLDD